GCFLPWPVALACCYWISPKHFWIAAAGCAAGYLNAAFMAVGEHIVAHALFWPSLFVILFAKPLKPAAAIILLAAATGMLFSYESQIFLCVPLLILALWRARQERMERERWTWVIFLVAAALFAAGIVVGLCSIFMPELPANYVGFKAGTLSLFKHMGWTLTWTVAWIALGLAAVFSESIQKIISQRIAVCLLLGVLLFWGMWPMLAPNRWDSGVTVDNRSMDLFVPLALLPVALIARFRPGWMEDKRKRLEQWIAALLIAQSLWQISATVHWAQDVLWMREVLATHQGIVPLHSTVLAADGMEGRELRPDVIGGRFDWTWPCLSIALAPSPKINCFICSEVFLVPAVREHYWQPFDPLNPRTLLDLTHYGIDYSGYLAAMNAPARK
ncbi:MAG TPA: hypothetical protein VMJ12_17210, partial [Candidatus Acidoferrales bacterium]|nr:hypothetical protein [Candidatus Acidoferrales bacterium]